MSRGDLHHLTSGAAGNFEEKLDHIVAGYIDRLTEGELLDPDVVHRDHPEMAEEILATLETFVEAAPRGQDGLESLGTIGDYRLRRQMGRGGMGVVYEAWQRSMDRRVALKVLPPAVAVDSKACARFLREAQAAGRLSHANVVSVYAMGVDDRVPYYAMEYVEGETLAGILRRRRESNDDDRCATVELDPGALLVGGPRDLEHFARVAKTFAEVAEGLQHAHSKGVIHRDIKPSNLILDSQGRLRILDFGLARVEGQDSLTVSGDVVGTLLYMSPEQARRRQVAVDQRTDVYSLGATLYEVLTGRPPFRGKNNQDTLSQIIDREPTEPCRIEPRVPSDLETIVLKCLRKEPRDRYGTAEALAQDLSRFARGAPIEARPLSQWERFVRRAWYYRLRLTALVLVALLVAVTGSLYVKEQRFRYQLELAQYDANVSKAIQKMHFGRLTTRVGVERVRRLDPLGFFFIDGSRAGATEPLLQAVDDLAELCRRVPERADAYYHRARGLFMLGEDEEALEELETASSVAGDFVPAELLRNAILERRGDVGRAQAVPGSRTPPLLRSPWADALVAARRAAEEMRWKDAVLAYTSALESDTREVERGGRERYVGSLAETRLARGMASLKAQDLEAAIRDFAVAQATWREALDPVLLLGEAYGLDGKHEEAAVIFEAFWGTTEFRDEAALGIAARYYYRGDFGKGLAWANRIEDDLARERTRIPFLLKRGRSAEAVLAGESVLAEVGDSLLSSNLAGALWLQEEWDRARSLFEQAVQLDSSNVWAWHGLGRVLLYAGDLDAAIKVLERSIEVRDAFIFRSYLAQALFYMGEVEAAHEHFRKGIAVGSKWGLGSAEVYASGVGNWEIDLDFAGFLLRLERWEEALALYAKVLEARPGQRQAHRRLCDLFRHESSPEFWIAVDRLVRRLKAHEEGEELHASVQRTLALAFAYHPEGQDLDTALDHARAAVDQKHARNPDLLAALAEVQAVCGDLPGAVSTLERAVSSPGADAFLRGALSDLREALLPDFVSYISADSVLAGRAEVLVHDEADWALFKGVAEPSPDLEWTTPGFDDSDWKRGPGPFGHGFRHSCGTWLDDMPGGYTTLYLRSNFEVQDPSRLERLLLLVAGGDGFVAYINGSEVARSRAGPTGVRLSHKATSSESRWLPPCVVEVEPDRLVAGGNVLALQGLEHSSRRSDFYLQALLIAEWRFDAEKSDELLSGFRGVSRDPEAAVYARDLAFYLEARLLQLEGKTSDASERLLDLAVRVPHEPLVHLRLAESLRSEGRPREAETALRAVLPRFPQSSDLWGLWFMTAAIDLRMGTAELLASFTAEDQKSARGYGADVLWLLTRLLAGQALRINCGGKQFTDAEGFVWSEDRFFSEGGVARRVKLQDALPRDNRLYRTYHLFASRGSAPVGYRVPLPIGTYRVTLHFAETYYVNPDHREFSVRSEGKELLREYSPGRAGFATKDPRTFVVRVEDGFLDLEFVRRSAYAVIYGLEIELANRG